MNGGCVGVFNGGGGFNFGMNMNCGGGFNCVAWVEALASVPL